MSPQMLTRIAQRFKEFERASRSSIGNDISTPQARRAAWWYTELFDHAVLRRAWSNFAEVGPGAYRANHPNHQRLEYYRSLGIRSVLTLRGNGSGAPFLFEEESCRQLGMTLHYVALNARNAPDPAELAKLFELFRTIERPFLMHCKSGADRAGLASALYQMAQMGLPVEVARKQLSFRYLHIRASETGILDHLLDTYAAHNAGNPIPIEQWVASEYDPEALERSFAAKRGRRRS